MTQYIALIRGINVGGNNKVPMPELRTAFDAAGFDNVSTYINSGNVLFESSETDEALLVEMCEKILRQKFGVTTRVAVIPAEELQDAMNNAPIWWGSDPESKHNAIFVIAPATAGIIAKEAGDIKPEYENIAHYKNVIFWSAPLKTFNRTRWSKIVSTHAYRDITIRNANTAKKLAELTA